MNKFYIGDICWVISDEEYHQFAYPANFQGSVYVFGSDCITRGDSKSGTWETIDFLTTMASPAGWPQDSGVLGVLRFDDLEPEYQERAEGGVQLRVEGSLQDRFGKHELRAH